MPIDAPIIAVLAQEISQKLPLKIDRIHQPYPDEFLFSGYGSGESLKLLISLHAQFGRIHFFEGTRVNPLNPSAFSMLLRKHFGGAKLINCEAIPFERILKLTFEGYDPYVGISKKNLWIELTGKSSNLILTDHEGLIIDAWRRVTAHKPQMRELTGGNLYELPDTKGRWLPVTLNESQFSVLLNQIPAGVTLAEFLLKHWYGLSSLSINEITHDAGLTPDTFCIDSQNVATRLYQSFDNWTTTLRNKNFNPSCLYNQAGHPIDCAALMINHPPQDTTSQSVPHLGTLIATLVNHQHEKNRFKELQQNRLREIRLSLEKNQLKLSKQQAEAAAAEQGDSFRIIGELLTAYSYQITKGDKSIILINYFDPENPEISIKLDPSLPPQANAQAYFKKYHKAKKGQQAIATQIAKTDEMIMYLESLETMANNSQSIADLQLIKEELDLNKKKPKTNKNTKNNKKEAPSEPRRYHTPNGHLLLVGRNNLQNDRLTFKIADPTDLWFHTQKIPGSHVILKPQPGIPIDDESLNLACQLSAYFSKARESTKIPVDYTQRKNVKKPPAAKPGFVIYDYFKTAIITPDHNLLQLLGVVSEK